MSKPEIDKWSDRRPMRTGFYWMFSLCERLDGTRTLYGPVPIHVKEDGSHWHPKREGERELKTVWFMERIISPQPPFPLVF